ncbi:MAG: putative replicase protein [Alehxovirus allofundihabitans]|uniref:RNA-directed RNA polymerase n=1 Tax=Leviviridae sp. TaxID=2027243 RepID=A0ABY3SSC7_9VIRU|nr:MAG: putative replicase protein [Leviviridae sp.]
MKSYVLYLQGLYSAIISQIAEHRPHLQLDCLRDHSRLLSLVDRRGLHFLMIDLPLMGKHFDKCLAKGRLTPSGSAGQRPYKRNVAIPRLFKGLLQLVFDDSGVLRANPDIQAISYLRQLYYAAKKVKVPCEDSRTWEHVNEFFKVDLQCRHPSLEWDEDVIRTSDLDSVCLSDATVRSRDCGGNLSLFDGEPTQSDPPPERSTLEATQRVADIVSSLIGRFDPLEWRTKHGPGAVADLGRTQFKYDFPTWPAKLSGVFPQAEFAFANYGLWLDSLGSDGHFPSENEPPSKLIAVPKTLSGPRLIASEPVSHQWCQQAVKDFLATRLAETPIRSSIRFDDQTQNQAFALRASHTQSHVTVDLSSASDRLSCWVVERIFRRNHSLIEALHATRTRWVINTIDRKSPRYHRLRKFACMGSACTFPVQSYVFCILAVSSVLVSRGIYPTIRSIQKASQEVRVFGDDIIVPSDGWTVLQGLLGHLGLEVNHKKTFENGKFRESCGVDAYDGTDVTPTYSMTYPEVSRPGSIMSLVDTHNNFAKRGYWRVCEYIKSTVLKVRHFAFPQVPIGSGTLGWADPMGYDYSRLRRRYNRDLHRVEYLCDSAISRVTRTPPRSGSGILQYFTEAKHPPLSKEERLGPLQRVTSSLRRRWEVPGDFQFSGKVS